MRILIIDDNVSISTMLSEYLTMKGHECISSNDGRNGLNLIQKEKYDTVLLDLSMPHFSGLDVIDALEKDGTLKNQKIFIFTSSNTSNEKINELVDRGVYACIKKPIQLPELLEVITI